MLLVPDKCCGRSHEVSQHTSVVGAFKTLEPELTTHIVSWSGDLRLCLAVPVGVDLANIAEATTYEVENEPVLYCIRSDSSQSPIYKRQQT